MSRRVSIWTVEVFLIIVYVLLANDGRHHWHEFRQLYSATFYSTTELMQGAFDAGPAPIRTPDQVATWYATNLLHIYLLKQLVNLLGLGLQSYLLIKGIYAVLLATAVGLIGLTLRTLGMSTGRVRLVTGLLLLSPMTIYLGFKFMPEVPSLLFSAFALLLVTISYQKPLPGIIPGIMAGIALALSTLAHWQVPFLFLGFWLALLFVWRAKDSQKPIIRINIALWLAFLISMFAGLWFLGGSFRSYFESIVAFLAFTKSLPMWLFAIFNLGLAGMGLWLFLPLAWLSPDERSRRFFLVWLILSGVPTLVTSVQFMEPRYLVSGIIPFVGLAALGLEALWSRIQNWQPAGRIIWAAVFSVIMIAGTIVAQYFLPYETEANQLIQAVHSEAPPDSTTIVLLPWNYTDFHMLRFVFPDKPIYLVQSAVDQQGRLINDPIWTDKRAEMYGPHYLPDTEALFSLSNHRMIYIGWTVLPSLQNLHDFLMMTGLQGLAGQMEGFEFLNHLTQSWLWHDPQYSLNEMARYGQYQVYEVRPLEAGR